MPFDPAGFTPPSYDDDEPTQDEIFICETTPRDPFWPCVFLGFVVYCVFATIF